MATSLGSAPLISGQDVLVDSSTQQLALGTYAETNDGRGFRYCKVGLTATLPGRIYASAAEDTTNQQNLAVAAAAIGATSLTVSTSTTLAANLLAGGLLTVSVDPGGGYTYRIKSNTATTSATGCVITLEDPLVVALTTSSRIDVKPNPYNAVIITPAGTATGAPVGVATGIITASQFGWLQTHGPCSVLCSTTITIGNNIMPIFATTTGAATVAVDGVKASIGHALTGIATTEYGLVDLTID